MRLNKLWLGANVALMAVCVAVPAGAQSGDERGLPTARHQAHDEEARARFAAARMAFADGRFEDALIDFRRAYELSGRSALLFNIGSAAERLRRDDEALEAYEAYLEKTPNAENRPFVESRVSLLRRQIAEQEERERASRDDARGRELARSEVPTNERGEEPQGERRVRKSPWLWAAVGAVVIAGLVTTIAVTSPGSDFVGSDGKVHEALTLGKW